MDLGSIYTVTYPATTVLIAPNTVSVTGLESLYAESAVKVAARRICSMYSVLLMKLVDINASRLARSSWRVRW